LNVSEQKPEQINDETGSSSAEPTVPAVSLSSDAPGEPVVASVEKSTDAEPLEPMSAQGGAKIPEVEAPQADAQKADAHEPEAAKPDAPRIPGKVIIMASSDRAWDNKGAGLESEAGQKSGMFGKHRLAALAAVVALAVMAGALGGALATAGLKQFGGEDAVASGNRALEASVARIEADMLALKAGVDHTTKLGMSQFNKTSDRLDKLEKAQTEPAAKLAKLSEAVDKLRSQAPAVVAAAPVAAAKDVTGSIAAPAVAPATTPKTELARLPTVEGWVLRNVANGGALIEGRQGIYEVYAGDPVPGIGRVDAIRRQDGRWVVVTSKGLIVAR
jgi:hypothetical protein